MQFEMLFVVLYVLKQCIHGVPIETSPNNMESYFSPYILGGTDAPEGYAPHMAALLIGDVVTMIVCGGSIVLPNLILTAAHCIDVYEVTDGKTRGLMPTFHAVVGSQNWRTGGTAVQFKAYFMHPQWDPILIKNDVGFLALSEKLKMGENLKVVALNFNWVGGEEPSYVTGWGWIANWHITPFNLQILEVNTLTPQRCVYEVLKASASWWPHAPAVNPAIEICSLHSVGKGLCFGDSGSPLISRKSGAQIGLASWAFTCAHGVPDIHVRLSAYKRYIQYIMKKHQ